MKLTSKNKEGDSVYVYLSKGDTIFTFITEFSILCKLALFAEKLTFHKNALLRIRILAATPGGIHTPGARRLD